MRAMQFAEYGGPEVLRLVEIAEPHPQPGRIRIAVRAAAVNPADWKYRSGIMTVKTLPRTPGSDVSGVVDEVGDGVVDVRVGDEVFGSTLAGYAEFAVLSAWTAKPAAMSWAQAAAVPLAAETSARAFATIGVADGSTLLINGASGGVGSAAVQLAVARGIRVIAVAGEANRSYLTELGAEAVAYGGDLVERVRSIAPAGVDYAVDVAGSGVLPALIELTGNPATVVSIADFSAPELGAKATSGAAGRHWEVLAQVARLFQAGRFRVEIQQVFPLSAAGAAQALSQQGHVRGKLVLDVTR